MLFFKLCWNFGTVINICLALRTRCISIVTSATIKWHLQIEKLKYRFLLMVVLRLWKFDANFPFPVPGHLFAVIVVHKTKFYEPSLSFHDILYILVTAYILPAWKFVIIPVLPSLQLFEAKFKVNHDVGWFWSVYEQ